MKELTLFDSIFPGYRSMLFRPPMWSSWVYEKDNLSIDIVLPGYEEQDFELSAEDGELILSISGTKDNKIHTYSVYTEDGYNIENADATYKAGVLKIRIPKQVVDKPKVRIPIKVS